MVRGRLAKLHAMSTPEIAGRVSYRAFTTYERELHRRGLLSRPDRLRHRLRPDLAGRPDWEAALVAREGSPNFFVGPSSPATIDCYRTHFAAELNRSRRIADAVLRHEIAFFGQTFAFGPQIDWHADPVTQAQWPRVYHADVPIHGGNRGFGDVKHVWELNRHQFLIDLAKIALVDGSAQHAAEVHRLLRDWQAQTPYGTGVPWACALEPAFRVWSWLWAYEMLRAAGSVAPDDHTVWLTGFADHGRFLHRHLERWASPYNHLIGEASALFALGTLFPEFAEAPAWAARGRAILESTLETQFHADGGTVEQSTFYHHATLGFYLLAVLLARRNGSEFPARVIDAVERGLEFSMHLVQPDGRMPRIGGADDGKPIRLEHAPLFDFRSYLAIGAVMFSRSDFKHVAARFWEDALWILGADGAAAFERVAARAPATQTVLPASGYFIARSAWSEDADYLCFDCGPQAGGLRRDGVPSAAHGHADCLAIIAVLDGREVVVDPGFYCYNGDPAWEVHFRKTLAHSTVAIDRRDQARHVSKMAWAETYEPHWEGWRLDADGGWARGSHDGFARGAAPVRHRRTVWLRDAGYVVLLDELSGSGSHAVESILQCAPGSLALSEAGTAALFADRFEISWTASIALAPTVRAGGAAPSDGWVAPSLGIRQEAPRLVLSGTLDAHRAAILTIVADRYRAGGERVERVTAGIVEGTLYARVATADGGRDEIYAAVDGAVTRAGLVTDAPLVIVRHRDGFEPQPLQAGGTRVDFADHPSLASIS
jgi:hypothetical protein